LGTAFVVPVVYPVIEPDETLKRDGKLTDEIAEFERVRETVTSVLASPDPNVNPEGT
jgi:hypothetical protein